MHSCVDSPPHVHLSRAWSWAGRQRHPDLARLGVGFLGLIASPVLAIDLATLPMRRAASACCRSSPRQDEGAGGRAVATRLAQRCAERTPSTQMDEPALVSRRVIGWHEAAGPGSAAQPSREGASDRKGTPHAEAADRKLRAGQHLQLPAVEAFKACRRRLFEAREAVTRQRATLDAALALYMAAAERSAALDALDDAVHSLQGSPPGQLGFDEVRRQFPEPLRSRARAAHPATREAVLTYVQARLTAMHARDRALQLVKGLPNARALRDSLDPPAPAAR